MTTKKSTEETQQPSAVETVTADTLLAMYKEQVESMKLIRAALEAKGVQLETPPSEVTAVRRSPELLPGGKIGEGAAATWRPWRKEDLDAGGEKFSFVPQFIPPIVFPIPDENGLYKIILDVNDLQCCLTVGELNENISGMFYHHYKEIERNWKAGEVFKKKGPKNAPWLNQGPNGVSTWHYEPEAPSAWIDLKGNYYNPGAPMPGAEND